MKKLMPLFVLLLVTLGCEGPEGPTGAKGKDGNANVQSQTWSVSTDGWTYSASVYSWYVDINNQDIANLLTQDIVDYGAVVVYMKIGSGSWYLLPYTIFNTNPTYTTRYAALYSTGAVSLRVTDSDLTQPNDPGLRGIHYFKIVAIASLGKYSKDDIDWNNYEDVARKLE